MSNTQQPVLYYSRVNINKGAEDDFLSLVPKMVDIVSREPACLQIEAFYNQDLNQVVWLESFDGVQGLVGHINNPEMHELAPQVMPLVQMDVIRFLSTVPIPKELVSGLREMGLAS